MRIMIVVPTMGRGGAEIQLKSLAKRMVSRGHQVKMTVLLPVEDFGVELESAGVALDSLSMKRGVPKMSALIGLEQRMRSWKPDVVQTWMYSADVLGGIVARAKGIPLAWAIRGSEIHPTKRRSRYMMRVAAVLSHRLPQRIFVNSVVGRRVHVEAGYSDDRMLVIPNGFETVQFRRDETWRRAVRRELALEDAPVVGIVARFDPHKDYQTFFRAAGELRRRLNRVKFVIVGRGMAENADVVAWARAANVHDVCTFMGERTDLWRIYNAFDVATLTSVAEGCPNAIGEAMACEVPCAATDAGDTRQLIGNTGKVVCVGDHVALAEALYEMLTLHERERANLGVAARQRIVDGYGAEAVASMYESAWAVLRAD